MKNNFTVLLSFLIITISLAQKNFNSTDINEIALGAALNIIQNSKNCILITLDEKKAPQTRIMDALIPDDDFIVWMATNPNSRKVNQIRKNPKVVVFYTDKEDQGYVSIHGRAQLVSDDKSKQRYWKAEWEKYYPDREKGLILIKVIPDYLEVINYRSGVSGDSLTWQPEKMLFKK